MTFTPTTSKSVKHYKHCHAAWRIFIPARRFKLAVATTTHKLMNRLAAHASPPGDFWAEPRKRNKTIHSRQNPYSYDPTRYIMMNVIKGTRKQLPLPEIRAPNWDSHSPCTPFPFAKRTTLILLSLAPFTHQNCPFSLSELFAPFTDWFFLSFSLLSQA